MYGDQVAWAEDGSVTLDLSGAGIGHLDPSIGELTELTHLELAGNALTALPDEVARLENLVELDLWNNELRELPAAVTSLSELRRLDLGGNEIGELPAALGDLRELVVLRLIDNRLKGLPDEMRYLEHLTELHLGFNKFSAVPPVIRHLTMLGHLCVNRMDVGEVPPWIGELVELTELQFTNAKLRSLPPEIGRLARLRYLYLTGNELTELPFDDSVGAAEAGRQGLAGLAALAHLYVGRNALRALPDEIGRLSNLIEIAAEDNAITTLPPSIADLPELDNLDLTGNPLEEPPLHLVDQGVEAVQAYLREAMRRQWVGKLIVVGQADVGKTCLIDSLQGRPFTPNTMTEGVEVEAVELPHPEFDDVTIVMNTWDFGGQEIFYSTHQFFLTDHSVYLLVWKARHNPSQDRLAFWLDTIKARAPHSRVMIVATHCHEHDTLTYPIRSVMRDYPQVEGLWTVDNETRQGVDDLKAAIARVAATLPRMGRSWPSAWLDGAQAIRELEERHVGRDQLRGIAADRQVRDADVDVLATWLHDLGDILYFDDDPIFEDFVILRPQWVSKYISQVLLSEEVKDKDGIFTREHMGELWDDLDQAMQDQFLRLMERFDLSYRILDNRDVSLVVERLPADPPPFSERWDAALEDQRARQVAMHFNLSTIPAGIPSWIIARSHRFTTNTHWRSGALFADREKRHLALLRTVEQPAKPKSLHLTVRGPEPSNFLALLRDSVEYVLDRFKGLTVARIIPCPGHDGAGCDYEFEYEDLVARITEKPMIECPRSKGFQEVSVPGMLFGLDGAAQSAVESRLEELARSVEANHEAIGELTQLTQRNFTAAFVREQKKQDTRCPTTYVLRPVDAPKWRRRLVGQQVELQLYCQAPGVWHPTAEGGVYALNDPAAWIEKSAPYLRLLTQALRHVTPLLGPWLTMPALDYEQLVEADKAFMSSLMDELPPPAGHATGAVEAGSGAEAQRATGPAYRALHRLLEEQDLARHWGGLRFLMTPEGHAYWLCEHHYADLRKATHPD